MTAREAALSAALRPHRSEVLERWRSLVYRTYPEEAVRFLRSEKDAFKNPVGQAIRHATATILDRVLLQQGEEPTSDALERLVRIRAVQDFSPSEAVGFVFLLKRAARDVLEGAAGGDPPAPLLADLESRIDNLALAAFETYTRCREEVFDIRVRAAQRRTAALLERFNRETPADDAKLEAGRRPKGVEA